MSTSALVLLLTGWVALNGAFAALLARSSRERPESRASGVARRAYGASVDGYASVLLFRVLVQTCRVVGAPEACVLLRDPRQPDALVAVATHGLDEGLIGRCVATDYDGWALELVGADGRPIDMRNGVALPITRRAIGDCGYLWATAGPAAQLGDRQVRLLGELATVLAQTLDDVDDATHLDELIGRGLALVCADDHPGAAADHAALCRAVGERLGLDAPALIELDIAARVQHAVVAAPAAAVRSLPGFESVRIVLRFARERWDGSGPHGLRRDRIPLASRILAVCAALGTPSDVALRAIQGASGRAYDPDVVAAISAELLGPVRELDEPARHWADGDRLFAVTR